MRHLRTVLPVLATTVAVALGGTAFALAGAGPATSAAPASAGPAAALLTGSYQADFARLSVGGKARVSNKQVPQVSGKPRVGSTLTVTDGTWKPAQVKLSYAWFAGSKQIKGASHASYTPDVSVVGKEVTVQVTATKQGYRPATVDRKAGKVQAGAIKAVNDPEVRGTAAVGRTLQVTSGRWSPGDVTLDYVWTKGRTVVSKGQRYTVERSDRGAKLRVEVTASRAGYRSTSVVATSDTVKR